MAQGASFQDAEAGLVRCVVTLDPVLGTFTGLRGEHNSLLPPTDREARQAILGDASRSARALTEATMSAPSEDQIDADLAAGGVRGLEILEGALHSYDRDPDWYINGAVQAIYALLLWTALDEQERLEHMIARLDAVPEFLAVATSQIDRPPQVLLDNAEGDTEGAIDFFRDDLGEFISGVTDPAGREHLLRGQQASLQATEAFQADLKRLGLSSTRDFAIGRDAFKALLHEAHRLPMEAQELLDMGVEISAQLEAEMAELSRRCAGHPRWWDALEPLRDRHPTRDGLLDAYRSMALQAEQLVREMNLVDMSGALPLVIRETPAFARTNLPFAAYIQAPPMSETGNSEFWVTPVDDGLAPDRLEEALRGRNVGKQMISAVHEAYPGHHLQACYGSKVKRPLRHLFASTVTLEGWALYCEELMVREGFLASDPQADLLRIDQLRHALWRSLRVEIDVSLQCFEMTREQAVDLLVSKHVLSEGQAESEVMYYCSAPTQPMSYTVGKVLLEGLVKRCLEENPEGGLADAHRRLLSPGLLPYPLLERAMGLKGKT